MNNEQINEQTRDVIAKITLPMNFPNDWDDDMINFHLNESSWCWSNFLDGLNKYAKEHNGCICMICEGEVVSK